MSKPVLGRSLGKLLKDNQTEPSIGTPPAENSPAPSAAESPAETARLSPGMASLLRKPSTDPNPPVGSSPPVAPVPPENVPAPSPVKPPSNRMLRVSLVIGDVLLVALTAHLVFQRPGQLGSFEVILCVVAIALGGWLTCLAIWRDGS